MSTSKVAGCLDHMAGSIFTSESSKHGKRRVIRHDSSRDAVSCKEQVALADLGIWCEVLHKITLGIPLFVDAICPS